RTTRNAVCGSPPVGESGGAGSCDLPVLAPVVRLLSPAAGRQPQPNGAYVPQLPDTLGALRASPWGAPERAYRSVKDELRQNLLARLDCGGPLFEGVLGYEDTVMPQIVNAVLSRHNFILLGLRGQ